MAEITAVIGGAAAVTQLVHYGFEFVIAASALSHHIRHAPEKIQAWINQSVTMTLLLDDVQNRVNRLSGSTMQLLEQCRQDAEQLQILLHPFSVSLPIQKATRLSERKFVVRREAEVERLISSFRSTYHTLALDLIIVSLNPNSPLSQSDDTEGLIDHGQDNAHISVHQLREGCTSRNVLTTMCLFHDSAISLSLLARIFDRTSLSNAISDLVSRSLVRRIPTSKSIELSPHVRGVIQSEINVLPERSRSLNLALIALNATFGPRFARPRTLSRSHTLRPHVSTVLDSVMDFPPTRAIFREAAVLAVQYCMYLLATSCYASVMKFILIFRMWSQDFLASDFDAATALSGKEAVNYASDGDLNTALHLFRRLHRSRVKALGKSDIRTLHSMNGVGIVYDALGHHAKAKSYHRKALTRKARLLGEDDPDTLVSANNLGIVLLSEGHHTAAQKLFSRTLKEWLQVYDSDDLFVIGARSNLGIALHFQGRLDEAENLHRYALQERQRILGNTHHETTKSKANLAMTMNDSGRHIEAEALYREALDTFEDTLGASHPDTLKTHTNLATALHDQGNYDEAEKIVAAAIPLIRTKYGSTHTETIEAMEFRAILLHNLEKYSAGLRVASDVYKIRRDVLGYDHDDTQRSLQHVRDLAENWEAARTMSLFPDPSSVAVF